MLKNPSAQLYIIYFLKWLKKMLFLPWWIMYMIRFFVFLIILIKIQVVYSQPVLSDTSSSITDSIILWEEDTLLIKTPTERISRWANLKKISIDSLLFRQNRSRFSKELRNLLFRESGESIKTKKPLTNSTLILYDGKIIRNIEIQGTDIFASSVFDTAFVPSTWFQRTGNYLHSYTRQSIIRHNLLLKPGEQLDVFRAAENERIMRDLPYIMDARFLVRSIPGTSDSIDLILLTKDLWPVGLDLELSGTETGNASMWFVNMFGYGHQFKTTTYWDGNHTPYVGYRFTYGIPNFSGSFISTHFDYIHRWNTESAIINVFREFNTTKFKYAGGIRYENTSMQRNITLIDTILPDVSIKYANTDIWAGRMIRINKWHSAGMRSNMFLAGRLLLNVNWNGSEPDIKYLYNYEDKTQLLLTLGFSQQGFTKDNLIYTFGRIEDVPYGYLIEITPGYEWGKENNRSYFGFGASVANYIYNLGYIYGHLKYGTFFNGHSPEQSTISFQCKYFTRLYGRRQFQSRYFATLTYVDGSNRHQGEFVTLENQGGIWGLSGPSLRGYEKLVLNLESVLFSPYKLLGFRFAFFASANLGIINSTPEPSDSKLFTGLSAGIRFRNDHLVFDTFEIKFSFYPGLPGNSDADYFNMGDVARLRLNDFFPDKPAVISYQ
jgi:hypothetical protein